MARASTPERPAGPVDGRRRPGGIGEPSLVESQLSAIWAAGLGGGWQLVDGRTLRVVFPGTPGRGPGPDFRGAVIEVGGDTVVGDVELHSHDHGWVEHGHQEDSRYDSVALHVVGRVGAGREVTRSRSGREIPILVVAPGAESVMFEPPCSAARASRVRDTLAELGDERLEEKVGRLALLAEARGPAQSLYFASMEVLGGPPNRNAFAEIAQQVPLAVLLERAADTGSRRLRARVIAAELRWAAAGQPLRTDGQRPPADPRRRLEVAGGLIAALWPAGGAEAFPGRLNGSRPRLPGVPGLGASTRRELLINAVLPVAVLAGVSREDVASAYRGIASPGTYGQLRQLERWLGGEASKPFGSSRALQGGLLLHRRYCKRGMCGRCPLSGEEER